MYSEAAEFTACLLPDVMLILMIYRQWKGWRRMITISLCMIVKNEERLLGQCLDCLAGLMDEMIIVDTGSSDRTKEIARSYTKKVFDFEWDGDFSKARNFSFSKATMEYIYCADADEILDAENINKFKDLKSVLLPEIDIVQMKYCNQLAYNTVYNFDEEYRPKLFKRLRQFQWMDAIHEVVRLEPVVYDSDIAIIHKPLSSHVGRDLKAFVNIDRTGERLSARLHTMYARELYIGGSDEDFVQAVPVFEKTLADTGRSGDEIKEAVCVLARAYRCQKDTHRFFTNVVKNLALGSCAEICYELGKYYYDTGEMEEAAVWYYNAAFETECLLSLRIKQKDAVLGLADCYRAMGNEEKALEYEEVAKET